MMTCPACGKENEDAAVLCRRCRGPLRDEPDEELAHEAAQGHPQPAATADEPTASSDSLGEVCRRCDSYNEPGARRCSSCGSVLIAEAALAQHEPVHRVPALADEAPFDKTPAHPFAPPHHPEHDAHAGAQDTPAEGSPSVADELSALAISPEEAAEAGLSVHAGNGVGVHQDPPAHQEPAPPAHEELALDKTPPQAFQPFHPAGPEASKPSLIARGKVAVAEAAGVAVGAAAAVAGAVRRAPEPSSPAPPAPAPRAEPEQKPCAECAAMNPPAAKFCFDCGTPFARKSAAPPRAAEPSPAPRAPEPAAPAEPPPAEARRPISEPPPAVAALPRIQPLPRSWADHTDPGGDLPSIQVAGLESTTETAPVVLGQLHGPHGDEHAPRAAALAALDAGPHAQAPHAATGEHPPGALPSVVASHFEEASAHDAAAWDEPPVELEAPLAEPAPVEAAHEAPVEELSDPLPDPAPEPAVEELSEPLPDPEPPFHASLVLEKGPAAGTALLLSRLENTVGSAGAQIELADDPSVAPHAATVAFADDRLVLRDEGSANGVYLRVRETAPLEPGDFFYAGERLLRFDGPCELPLTHEGPVPFLGAPRPAGTTVRVTEVVAGGRTGRTCHRGGPTLSIGRTGCDMNFPADSLLGSRHAEVRLGDDGAVSVVDLGQGPSGVFIRLRSRGAQELQAGDIVRVGEQELRVELG